MIWEKARPEHLFVTNAHRWPAFSLDIKAGRNGLG